MHTITNSIVTVTLSFFILFNHDVTCHNYSFVPLYNSYNNQFKMSHTTVTCHSHITKPLVL